MPRTILQRILARPTDPRADHTANPPAELPETLLRDAEQVVREKPLPEAVEMIGINLRDSMKRTLSREEKVRLEDELAELMRYRRLVEDNCGDKYEVRDILGRGGMGVVLSAVDTSFPREVAIKIAARSSETSDPEGARDFAERFKREARVTGASDHPNIVPAYEWGEFSGPDGGKQPYYIMKRIKGDSLEQVLRDCASGSRESRRRWTQEELLKAFVSVCNGVHYAHAKGIIHRDLKPLNVMLGSHGDVYVIDWGLAKFKEEIRLETDRVGPTRESDTRVILSETGGIERTIEGERKGTPAYMAPEQMEGRNRAVDERTDVYALGCILYAILTYRVPFEDEMSREYGEFERAVVEREPPAPSERVRLDSLHSRGSEERGAFSFAPPDHPVHSALDAIALRALSKPQGARYSSALAMADDIRLYLDGKAAHVHASQGAGKSSHGRYATSVRDFDAAIADLEDRLQGVIGRIHELRQGFKTSDGAGRNSLRASLDLANADAVSLRMRLVALYLNKSRNLKYANASGYQEALKQADRMFGEVGSEMGKVGNAIRNSKVSVHVSSGDLEAAAAEYQKLIDENARSFLVANLNYAWAVEKRRGDLAAATSRLKRLETIGEILESDQMSAVYLYLSEAERLAGNLERALWYCEKASDAADRSADSFNRLEATKHRGSLFRDLGEDELAEQYLGEALRMTATVQSPINEGEILYLLGEIKERLDPAGALDCMERAARIAPSIAHPDFAYVKAGLEAYFARRKAAPDTLKRRRRTSARSGTSRGASTKKKREV